MSVPNETSKPNLFVLIGCEGIICFLVDFSLYISRPRCETAWDVCIPSGWFPASCAYHPSSIGTVCWAVFQHDDSVLISFIIFSIYKNILYYLKIKRLVKPKSSISIVVCFNKNFLHSK